VTEYCSICNAPLQGDFGGSRGDTYASYTCEHGPSPDYDYDRGRGKAGAPTYSNYNVSQPTYKTQFGSARDRASAEPNPCVEVGLKLKVAKLSALLSGIKDELRCRCDEAYTSRGRHEPNALCYLTEVIDDALKEI
jgi:hypothetical protein